MNASQHVIVCEGYDDRAFWAGWLRHLGARDLSLDSAGGQVRVVDPWGETVRGGQFGFETRNGTFIRLTPAHSREQVTRVAHTYLRDYPTKTVGHLLLSIDSARDAGEPLLTSGDIIQPFISNRVKQLPWYADDAELKLTAVIWQCGNESDSAGIPDKQTLERLLAASITAAYAGRGMAVESWLKGEPPGLVTGKAYSYSYYAKWYADHGVGDYYKALWNDSAIARELEARLCATGAWQAAEQLVNEE